MKLSIIIPTYNRSNLLVQAIDSILQQRIKVYEIVISDDCSTDDTRQVCQHYQQKQQSTRITWVSGQTNAGAQVARNRGLAASSGDVIMFMDSDDVIAEKGLFPLLKALESADIDYAYGKVVRTDNHLVPLKGTTAIGESFSSAPNDIAGYHWHTMGAIYRRSYLQRVGAWDEQLTGSQDWEFQARVKLANGNEVFVDQVVGLWRDHDEERVGAKRFRYDYVKSVIKACLLIHQQAESTLNLDAALERRLVKKLLLHVMELSANGFPDEREQHLRSILVQMRFNLALQLAIRALMSLSSVTDSILLKTFSHGAA